MEEPLQPNCLMSREVEQLLRERDVMLSEIRYHLQQAQDRMKLNAYRKRRELQFQVSRRLSILGTKALSSTVSVE